MAGRFDMWGSMWERLIRPEGGGGRGRFIFITNDQKCC